VPPGQTGEPTIPSVVPAALAGEVAPLTVAAARSLESRRPAYSHTQRDAGGCRHDETQGQCLRAHATDPSIARGKGPSKGSCLKSHETRVEAG
jgi:hypothetical protein